MDPIWPILPPNPEILQWRNRLQAKIVSKGHFFPKCA